MTGKFLGKITNAQYGLSKDRGFLMGLQLEFKFSGGVCSDGLKYTNNMEWSEHCKWTEEERNDGIIANQFELKKILEDAKCFHVSELINKPVEVEIEDNLFRSFRILTEVL